MVWLLSLRHTLNISQHWWTYRPEKTDGWKLEASTGRGSKPLTSKIRFLSSNHWKWPNQFHRHVGKPFLNHSQIAIQPWVQPWVPCGTVSTMGRWPHGHRYLEHHGRICGGGHLFEQWPTDCLSIVKGKTKMRTTSNHFQPDTFRDSKPRIEGLQLGSGPKGTCEILWECWSWDGKIVINPVAESCQFESWH